VLYWAQSGSEKPERKHTGERHSPSACGRIFQEDSSMSGLGDFHHGEEAEAKSSKLIHWIIGLVIVAAVGIYVFESGMFNSHTPQTASNYPRGL
jgi:hypothetical protein